MAILSVTELPRREGEGDEGYVRKDQRVFQVLSSVVNETVAAVRAAFGLPQVFDECPWDNGQFVVSSRPTQDPENPYLWEVAIRYASISFGALGKTDPSQRAQNPTDRPAEVDLEFEESDEAVMWDRDGRPVLNSAGDPLDPPITRSAGVAVITVTKNIPSASFSLITAERYYDAINDNEFLGFDARTLKIRITARREYENRLYFWRVKGVIKVRRGWIDEDGNDRGTWVTEVYDAGWRALDPGDDLGEAPAKPVLEKSGHEPAKPVFLDGTGHVLAAGADPVILRFRTLYERDFGALGFFS